MNKKLLLENVKFPLKWDSDKYKVYILDSVNQIIAQIDIHQNATEWEHAFHKLVGDFKEVSVSDQSTRYFLYQGDFYDQEEGKRIGLVCAYGKLQYKENPEKRQDNIAEYILIVLNS